MKKIPTMAVSPFRLLACLLFLTLTTCNLENELDRYFAERGLNRLAILRDDIAPGALILSGQQGAIYAGQMLDYRKRDSVLSDLPTPTTEPSVDLYHAAFEQYKGEKTLSAEAALSFLYGLFQFDPGVKLDLKGKVEIEILDSTFEKMKVPEIQRFLGSHEAQPFINVVLDAWADHDTAFLAYEVHCSTHLKIKSASADDVAPSLAVGTVGQLPLKGKASLGYKKLSSRELLLEGNRPYVFAVRTAELLPGRVEGSLRLKVTEFLAPGAVKGAGTDERYSAPIREGFGAVQLVDRLR
jgi:hypothetical protein